MADCSMVLWDQGKAAPRICEKHGVLCRDLGQIELMAHRMERECADLWPQTVAAQVAKPRPAPVGTPEEPTRTLTPEEVRAACAGILRRHMNEALRISMDLSADRHSRALCQKLELRAEEFRILSEELSNLPLTVLNV